MTKLNEGFKFEGYSNYISNSHCTTSNVVFEKNLYKVVIKYVKERVEDAKSVEKTKPFVEVIQVPLISCKLVINYAIALELIDPDQLGSFSISEIEYDKGEKQIKIISNTSLLLVVDVDMVDLEFYESPDVIGYQEKRIYFGRLEYENAQGTIINSDPTG